jgi:hypothetical protein
MEINLCVQVPDAWGLPMCDQERRDRGDDSLEQQGSHPDFKLRKGDRVKYVGGSDRLGRSEKTRCIFSAIICFGVR